MAALLLVSGCARLTYDVHHAMREIREFTGNDGWCYYHSPETG